MAYMFKHLVNFYMVDNVYHTKKIIRQKRRICLLVALLGGDLRPLANNVTLIMYT